MLDVGFSELIVIAVVALVVIGPERMPTVARTAGALFGRARRYIDDVKSEIERQVNLDEIKRIEATFYDAAKSIEHSVQQAGSEVQGAVDSLNQDVAALTHGDAEVVAGRPPNVTVTVMQPEPASAQLDLCLEPPPAAQQAQTQLA